MVMHPSARRALRRRALLDACIGLITHPLRLLTRAGRRRVAGDFRYAVTAGQGSGLVVPDRGDD